MRRPQGDGYNLRLVRSTLKEVSPYAGASQRELHSVIRNTDVDTSLSGHRADLGGDIMFVAGHDFRSAMRDDCARDAFFMALCQLRPNRRVTNQRSAAFANKGARYRGVGAHDAAHHFCVSRFWYVADEQNFLGSERFAKLGGERVF